MRPLLLIIRRYTVLQLLPIQMSNSFCNNNLAQGEGYYGKRLSEPLFVNINRIIIIITDAPLYLTASQYRSRGALIDVMYIHLT